MSEEARTMSGPATRPERSVADTLAQAVYSGAIQESDVPKFEPVVLSKFEARLTVSNAEGETVLNLTAYGSPRVVDQILHIASDAFREDVEP